MANVRTELDMAKLTQPERYKLLIGLITPRPIAWVSTVSLQGRPNLAPFSFFNGVGSSPMLVMFCPANKMDGTEKDTLRNAKPVSEGGQGEFVINLVGHALGPAMSVTAAELAYGESEWELAKLETEPSAMVRPTRVRLSKACFECRTVQVVRTNVGQPGGGNIVLGEVLHVACGLGVLNERLHADAAELDNVGRMGGPNAYCTTREGYEMERGGRIGG